MTDWQGLVRSILAWFGNTEFGILAGYRKEEFGKLTGSGKKDVVRLRGSGKTGFDSLSWVRFSRL